MDVMYQTLDASYIFSLCLGIVIFVIIIVFQNKDRQAHHAPCRQSEVTGAQFVACASLDCVRCHCYQRMRAAAGPKLRQFIRSNGGTGDLAREDSVQDTGGGQEIPINLQNLANSLASSSPVVFAEGALQRPNVLWVPHLHASPWWDRDLLAAHTDLSRDVHLLEAQHQLIADEFQHIVSDKASSQWTCNSTESGSWDTFYLYNQGRRVEANCSACPRTCGVLGELRSLMAAAGCVLGNALFSVLHPGTALEQHYGPCNVRLRAHLGIAVPDGCWLTVGGEARRWEEGKVLCFDDSFLHTATHSGHGGGSRAVLILDCWHPGLNSEEREAVQYVFYSE